MPYFHYSCKLHTELQPLNFIKAALEIGWWPRFAWQWSPTPTGLWRLSHQHALWGLALCCFLEWEAWSLTLFCLLSIPNTAFPRVFWQECLIETLESVWVPFPLLGLLYLSYCESQRHHAIDCLEERGVERGSARRSSLGKLLRQGGGIQAFLTDTILNWTELNWAGDWGIVCSTFLYCTTKRCRHKTAGTSWLWESPPVHVPVLTSCCLYNSCTLGCCQQSVKIYSCCQQWQKGFTHAFLGT